MCWRFLMGGTSCHAWLANIRDPKSVSRLFLLALRSQSSSRATQRTPLLSWIGGSLFSIVVNPLKPSFVLLVWAAWFNRFLLCPPQKWSLTTLAPPSPKLSSAGAARPTPSLWGAACWPISANLGTTSAARTSSPASGTCLGVAAHPLVSKVGKSFWRSYRGKIWLFFVLWCCRSSAPIDAALDQLNLKIVANHNLCIYFLEMFTHHPKSFVFGTKF